jgi:hypothetical protein
MRDGDGILWSDQRSVKWLFVYLMRRVCEHRAGVKPGFEDWFHAMPGLAHHPECEPARFLATLGMTTAG